MNHRATHFIHHHEGDGIKTYILGEFMKTILKNRLAAMLVITMTAFFTVQAQETVQGQAVDTQTVATVPSNEPSPATSTTANAETVDPVAAEDKKIAKSEQSIRVTSNPVGAECTIMFGEDLVGTVASTPADIVIKRARKIKFSADVTCTKEGYETTTAKLINKPSENAVDGNIGAIFTVVKALEGSLAEWEDSIHVKMEPSYFKSTLDRDQYLDAEKALLNSDFQTASEKYLNCSRKRCQKKLAKLQSQYDESLAELEAKIAAIPLN